MKKIVILTGAGISAESGIATYRDKDGLWDNYKIEDVCTSYAIKNNREEVIAFYNTRRKEIFAKRPNIAHMSLVELEKFYDVTIITQNIDNFHEEAGSTKIIHLHGEITKLRSTKNEKEKIDINHWEQPLDTKHSDGSLLRPDIVFFGEDVPMMTKAIEIVKKADLFIIIGTSLNVYPASSLLDYLPDKVKTYIVDSRYIHINRVNLKQITKKATIGVPSLVKKIIDNIY